MGESTIDPAALFERLRVFITAATDQTEGPQPAWEEAGQDVWDAGSLELPAQVLKTAGASEMLRSLAQHAVTKRNWRAAELAVGTLANFGCHASIRPSLLESTSLAEFVTQEGLTCEDAATAGEACRLCSAVLFDNTAPSSCTAAHSNPWSLALTAPPTLAQLFWLATNATRANVAHRALAVLTAVCPCYSSQLPGQKKEDLAQQLMQLGALPLIASALGSWLAARAEEDKDMDEARAGTEAPVFSPGEEPSIGCIATENIVVEVLGFLDRLAATECGKDAIVRHESLGASLVQLIAAEQAFFSAVSRLAVQVLAQVGVASGVWLAGNGTAVHVVVELLLGSPSVSFEEEESVAALWHAWCAVSLFLAEMPGPQLAAHAAVLKDILSTEGEILRRAAESHGKQQEREGLCDLLAYAEGVLTRLRARVA